jgi:dynein heavy chain
VQGSLLSLKLHEHVDSVSEIVDRAQKELIIEKALKKIDETWVSLTLAFTPHPGTGVATISLDDTVMESLESDQLQLQTMGAGKYVQGNPKFQEEVAKWQKRLGGVDTCLQTWTDVQKKWTALEAIFVGSEDIRVQLPEDSKRFDAIDADWRDLMKVSPTSRQMTSAALCVSSLPCISCVPSCTRNTGDARSGPSTVFFHQSILHSKIDSGSPSKTLYGRNATTLP